MEKLKNSGKAIKNQKVKPPAQKAWGRNTTKWYTNCNQAIATGNPKKSHTQQKPQSDTTTRRPLWCNEQQCHTKAHDNVDQKTTDAGIPAEQRDALTETCIQYPQRYTFQ